MFNIKTEKTESLTNNVTPKRWDIFCNIVDNFGDIGVCWRLSQQLANEHQLNVRLFIDDFYIASKIIPAFNPQKHQQSIQNVEIMAWPTQETTLPEVVIENFSCQLPEIYTQQIKQHNQLCSQKNPIIWINLEYLSAEKWVEDCHTLPSTHPVNGITKTYFYPGFTKKTGGLLREKWLIEQRNKFFNSSHLQMAFWQKYIAPNQLTSITDSIKISLFSYPQADIKNLILFLLKNKKTIHIFFPFNSEITTFNDIIKEYQLNLGEVKEINQIKLHLLPFLSQSEYDQLLWACDLNFVRGEDSWIRAIWAGKPFIWQPYIQEENAHLKKLAAFLHIYTQEANSKIKAFIQDAHHVWSNAIKMPTPNFWDELLNNLSVWQAFSTQQSSRFAKQASLTHQLVQFCTEQNTKN